MKFPVPKTLVGANLPIILINWVFGFGVIQYPMGTPRPILSAFWSIGNFLTYLSFVRMANFPAIMEIHEFKIAAINYRMNAYYCVVFIAWFMFLGRTRAKLIWRTFAKLSDTNDRMKILGIPNDHDVTFKVQITYLSCGFAVIFTIAVLDFKFVNLQFPSELSRLGFLMTFHYFLLLTSVADFNISVTTSYFSNRFQRLNELLLELNLLESNEMTVTQPDNQFPHDSSVIHEIHGRNSSSFRAANKHWLLYVIRETRKIHRGLCKMVKEMSRAFGFQVLLSVSLTTCLTISLLYTLYAISTASSFTDTTLENWKAKIMTLMWITVFAAKVLLLVHTCHTTSCKANETGELISKLLNTRIYDEDIRDEIHIFSFQLLQNPLHFTANGFFTLNYSLVHEIIGSVTTYLIIMIQMRSIYEPENLNSTFHSTTLVHTNDMN